MDTRTRLWHAGEDAAADLLCRNGLSVVERNYRCDLGEIDLVAAAPGLIVFCEVKARATDRWGLPAEAVDHRKQRRLRRLASRWLSERRPGRVRVRFDVVSVVARGPRLEVSHFPEAF